jgi:predicted DNA-binding protein
MKHYTETVPVRMTPEEKTRLEEIVKDTGLSLSRYLVECGLTKDVPDQEDRRQREIALREIKRVGNNLNQIARQLNLQDGTVAHGEIAHTLATLRQVLEKMGQLWQQPSPSSK